MNLGIARTLKAYLWSILGILSMLFALKQFPFVAQASPPYLNTSICLASVVATAVVDEDGGKIIVGWPASMPTTLPAAVSCFPLGAVIRTTTPESSPTPASAVQDSTSADIDSRPGGVINPSECLT